MPRIGGINIVGVLVATLAFYFVGFIFYGVIFTEEWSFTLLEARSELELDTIRQMSDERFQAAWAEHIGGSAGLSMGLGFVNALVTVVFLAIILRQLTAAAPSLVANVGYALLLWAGFAATTLAYNHIYANAPMAFFRIDMLHLFVAYAVGGAVLSFFD